MAEELDGALLLAVELPPIGTTEKTRKAGTSDRNGARMNTGLSARSGSRSSLKKNLMPSARVWRMPNGPARLGPRRFDMSACTLRSNQIMNSTETSSSANVRGP